MENAVESVMSTRIETIDILESAYVAAKKMRDEKISSLIVVNSKNGDEPLGILTETDLVHRVCAHEKSSKDVRVQDIMSSPIATIEANSTVEGAADLMLSNKVRHLLVMNQDKAPIGIVAPTDLNKYLRANIDVDKTKAKILKAVVLDGGEMSEP